jgi:HSP20 family protein
MYEDADNVVVKLAVPTFNEEDLEISIEDNVLTISGSSKEEQEENEGKKFYYKGIKTESFSRSVSLPVRVKADVAEAEVKNGVLHITMPKAEESKASKIMFKGKK